MASVLLATCAHLPGGDDDARMSGTLLDRGEMAARWASWSDPDAVPDDALAVFCGLDKFVATIAVRA